MQIQSFPQSSAKEPWDALNLLIRVAVLELGRAPRVCKCHAFSCHQLCSSAPELLISSRFSSPYPDLPQPACSLPASYLTCHYLPLGQALATF